MVRGLGRVLGLLVCLIVLHAPAALADDNSITYAGEVDTAGPLVMDTSNADDPQTNDLYAASSPIVLFIQRMPVTKTITAVTFGDLGQGSTSCSGSPTILVRIREITSKVLPNGTELATSQSQPLSATPSRITWPLSTPLTLKQGHAYAFTIGVTGCTYVRQTTWRHNSSLLEPAPRETGTSSCRLVQSGSGSSSPVDRQWHDYGSYDFFGTGRCLDYGQPAADMPSGWLAVRHNAGNSYIVTIGVPHGHGAPTYCDEGVYAGFGLTPVFWKTDQYGSDNYVCQWSVFADWLSPGASGSTQRYGWWYAMPFWPTRDALPNHAGAMYVKLDSVDFKPMLDQYAPLLKYDSRESYLAESADSITLFQGSTCGEAATAPMACTTALVPSFTRPATASVRSQLLPASAWICSGHKERRIPTVASGSLTAVTTSTSAMAITPLTQASATATRGMPTTFTGARIRTQRARCGCSTGSSITTTTPMRSGLAITKETGRTSK